MTVAELEVRMGSAEVAEWIVELGTLRPEDERAAIEHARAEAGGGRSHLEQPSPAAVVAGGAAQGRQDVPFFGPEGPPGFWTPEELERQRRGTTPLELAAFNQLVRGSEAVN